jgi:hypothetical protein
LLRGIAKPGCGSDSSASHDPDRGDECFRLYLKPAVSASGYNCKCAAALQLQFVFE